MKTKIIRFYDYVIDIFCPNRCVCCGKVIMWNEVFCEACKAAVNVDFIEENPNPFLFPSDINGKNPMYDYAQSLYYYNGKAKEAVIGLKFNNGLRFAKYAAELLCTKTDGENMGNADLVTAVPMYLPKKLVRGYNQAEVIARQVSRSMQIPCNFKLLGHKKSVEQHTLGAEDRYKSADRSYYIKDKQCNLSGKHIILCDDVFTTGATVNCCAGLLKALGAEKVSVLTICKTSSV